MTFPILPTDSTNYGIRPATFLPYRLAKALVAVVAFIVLLATVIHSSITLHQHWQTISSICRTNLIIGHSPRWAHGYIENHVPETIYHLNPPPTSQALLDAPWAGTWSTPTLVSPSCDGLSSFDPNNPSDANGNDVPALMIIHIFSSAFPKSRTKRDTIRSVDLLQSIPPEYRHLIEMKFVLGRSEDEEWEKQLDIEAAEYGDLVRLDNLFDGENMDHGKSARWIRYVGREGGRKAWWVFKCDDDVSFIIRVAR
jgi:hypothetical protein